MIRTDPIEEFQSEAYVRHNARRLEHLASLGLDLCGKSVLEVGAGIGDHTSFYLDRGCRVLVTEARPENLAVLRRRFAGNERVRVEVLDLESPPARTLGTFDLVHCYGVLYHLADPARAVVYLAGCCEGLMVVESCVWYGDAPALNPVEEDRRIPSQALRGRACRPSRSWLRDALRDSFAYVYATATQPAHEEFPLDWTEPRPAGSLVRAVFVASHRPLSIPALLESLPLRQRIA